MKKNEHSYYMSWKQYVGISTGTGTLSETSTGQDQQENQEHIKKVNSSDKKD